MNKNTNKRNRNRRRCESHTIMQVAQRLPPHYNPSTPFIHCHTKSTIPTKHKQSEP